MANKKAIYFDNAATTRIDPAVLKEMLPFLKEKYGNASSKHPLGFESREAVNKARRIIASSINANEKEIYFTSGGTEANNLALKGVFFASQHKKHIITTQIEHPSVLDVCKWLEKEGIRASYLNVDSEGLISPLDIERAITKDTLIVSVIHGNNEIGTVQNIEEIGRICRQKGVLFHVDACQSYGKTELNVKKQNIDLLTINSHKIHGPKGIGALYVREGIRISPLFHGGGQERRLRSGTENVASIVGFGKAADVLMRTKEKDIKKMELLREKLIKGILDIGNTMINGARKKRLCNNVNVSFMNVEGEAIQGYLAEEGIYVSTGSACSSHSLEPSHVLTSIGLSEMEANTSIRISLSKFNTEKDVDKLLDVLPEIITKLRRMSPFN